MFTVKPRLSGVPSQSPGRQSPLGNDRSISTTYQVDHSRSNPVSVIERFGKRLRDLRHERDMTQTELADFLGIDRSFINDVERGKKTMSLGYLDTVAQGFELTLAELMRGL